MESNRSEFVRQLGCLRIHIQRLEQSLRRNELSGIEEQSQAVQEVLVDLLKRQRKLSKPDQQSLRAKFVGLRQEALRCLEISRRILDDSLRALLELVKIVEESSNYGQASSGKSVVVDRKA